MDSGGSRPALTGPPVLLHSWRALPHVRLDPMGGKPSRGTPADKRLKANRTGSSSSSSAPKADPPFGSAAWRAKHGKK